MSSNITQLDIHQINKRAKGSKQSWEDLDNIYEAIIDGLVQMGINVNNIVAKIKDHPNVNKSILKVTVEGLSNDIERYLSDLTRIHNKHANKKGVITDGDELALCLSLFNDYYTVHEYIQKTMIDPIITITELATSANEQVTL